MKDGKNSSTSVMEGIIKREEPRLEMGIEDIVNFLSSASLVSVTVGDFLVIMRSEFDLTISGEPYTGLLLLLNLTTGQYFSRIWNQTVDTGSIVHTDQLLEACERHFGNGRPCLGCPEEEDKHVDAESFISQTPIPRRIARGCLKLLGNNSHTSVSSCSECTKLSESCLSGANDAGVDIEAPSSSCKFIKNTGGNESLISGEYNNEYVEQIVIKPEILDHDDFQGGDSTDYDEIDNQSVKQQNNDSLGVSSQELVKGNSTENESKKYKCELCPHRSAKKSALKKHIETVHENIRKYVCQQCGYAASAKSNLKSHIESVHEKKKDHVCPLCGKAFTKKALKVHIQGVHQNIKNFICGECGRAFSQKGDLTRHQKRHEKLGSSVNDLCRSISS